MTATMNQRDEAEGRNTERERLRDELVIDEICRAENLNKNLGVHQTTHDVRTAQAAARYAAGVIFSLLRTEAADMLRADAGNEATIAQQTLMIANRDAYIEAIQEGCAARDAELAELRRLLTDIRDDVKEAWNYSVLDDARNQTKVDKHFGDRMARIDAAIAAAANPVDEGEDKK